MLLAEIRARVAAHEKILSKSRKYKYIRVHAVLIQDLIRHCRRFRFGDRLTGRRLLTHVLLLARRFESHPNRCEDTIPRYSSISSESLCTLSVVHDLNLKLFTADLDTRYSLGADKDAPAKTGGMRTLENVGEIVSWNLLWCMPLLFCKFEFPDMIRPLDS